MYKTYSLSYFFVKYTHIVYTDNTVYMYVKNVCNSF